MQGKGNECVSPSSPSHSHNHQHNHNHHHPLHRRRRHDFDFTVDMYCIQVVTKNVQFHSNLSN